VAVSHGAKVDVVTGSVVEDWDLSGLGLGECLVSLPTGPPFRFRHRPFANERKGQP
jgi:hypothetical protein